MTHTIEHPRENQCPMCMGPISKYMSKKEGICWPCIKMDSKGSVYRLRVIGKAQSLDRRSGNNE